jgi:hypothetical protein
MTTMTLPVEGENLPRTQIGAILFIRPGLLHMGANAADHDQRTCMLAHLLERLRCLEQQ